MRSVNRTGWDTPASQVGAGSVSLLTPVPTWIKVGVGITATALAAAALTNSITLFSLIPGGVIHAVKIKHSTAFGGGLIAAYTVSVGIAGTLAKYAPAFDVFQAPGATVMENSFIGGSENQATAVNILLSAFSVGANLDQATAGVVDIWALLSKAA